MMKLYSMAGTCALSVHIALEWAGAPYDLEMMKHGDNRSSEYLAINPSGQVPAIVLDDGMVLTQAAAILSWIADSYPAAALWAPSEAPIDRFKLAERLAFFTDEVHGAFGPFFAPQRFLHDASQADLIKHAALARVAAQMATLDDAMGARDTVLDARSVADAYLYVLTRWADNLADGIMPYANLRRFRGTIEADAGVARALEMQLMKPLGVG